MSFADCPGLKDFTVSWSTPLPINSSVFSGSEDLSGCTLHVPSGTKPLYEAADVWKDFGTIVGDGTNGISDIGNGTRMQATVANGILVITSPAAEKVYVYSATGALLYNASKAAGEVNYNISNLPKGVLIVTGSSGWTQKIILK